MKVILCAPTGLAALRMKDACKYEATTIHRALGKSEGITLKNADMIIVDEMSMVGIELFRNLISRVRDEAIVLLVGDPDQLQSIDPGNVLADLINCGVIPVCRLTKIHRTASGSLICENAARILAGEMPIMVPGNTEFHMAFCEDLNEIVNATVSIAHFLTEKLAIAERSSGVQVVVPTNGGVLGAEGLNRELRKKLNAQNVSVSGTNKYAFDDKVLQIENDYDRDVVNGEIGRVLMAAADNVLVQFLGHRVDYSGAELSQLKHAYGITIHKSQGSEFPWVIIVIANVHGPMLTRRLIYTAFTRGKQKVIIIGQMSALKRAIDNNRDDVRYTGLATGLASKLPRLM